MDFSAASERERQKILILSNALGKKTVGRAIRLELYYNYEIIQAEIVKQYDQGVVKYFLVKPVETIKAGYLQALWEKELFQWTWGSKEISIEP